MSEQKIKAEIVNNIIVSMSTYLENETITILEHVIQNELIKVNMQEITTLPQVRNKDVEDRNYYIIELFKIKRGNDLTPETVYNYLMSVRMLVMDIPHKSLDQMDTMDIEWFLNRYSKHEGSQGVLKDTTWNNMRRYLSAFFTWMRKIKLISENPVEAIPPKKIILGPIDYFASEDLNKMRDACRDTRERAIIEIFRSTGARIGELVEIKMDQVDLKTGDIFIKGEKGGRYRTLYLDEDARYYLRLYLNNRPKEVTHLIASINKPYSQMSKAGLRMIVKNIANCAEVTCRAYPHKYRKTLGMNLKNKGVDIGVIQEVMGHASPAVTAQYYAQFTPSTLRHMRERVG